MTHYAVIGRIPFDDEDSIMFYESDEENPPPPLPPEDSGSLGGFLFQGVP